MAATTGREVSRPELSADLGLAALLRIPVPVLVFTAAHDVAIANQAAERLLAPFRSRQEEDVQSSTVVGLHITRLGKINLAHESKGLVDWKTLLEGEGRQGGNTTEESHGDVFIAPFDEAQTERVVKLSITASTLSSAGQEYHLVTFGPASTEIVADAEYHAVEAPPSHSSRRSSVQGVSSLDQQACIRELRNGVLDTIDEVIFLVSADGKTIILNAAAQRMVGPVASAAVGNDGQAFQKVFPAYDLEFKNEIAHKDRPAGKCLRTRRDVPEHLLGFINTATGEKIVMRIGVLCMHDQSGTFMGGLCTIREPLEIGRYLVQREEDRVSSFETLCNVMPHMVWRGTTGGSIDYLSKRWYEYTGMTPEASLGQGFQDAVHPEELSLLLKRWEYGYTTETECTTEARYRRHDGTYRWMLVWGVPFKDESGRILAWYGTITDIHEHVMSRIKNRRVKEQMLAVLAHAEVNLFAIGLDGTLTMAEGELSWGFDPHNKTHRDTVLGKHYGELTRGADCDVFSDGFENQIQNILSGTVKMSVAEYTIGAKTFRTRIVADVTRTGSDGDDTLCVNGVLGMSLDISDMTARAALEVENASLQVEEQSAQRANKMKSQFLANMSHEMRTPLAGVIGLIDLLYDTVLNPEQLDYVKNIRLSSSMLLTIVNDVLDFSKIESGRLDIEEMPFRLAESMSELHQLLIPSAHHKGLQLIYKPNIPSDLEVCGDPGRIRQVLLNLITNAIKFTKRGSVTFSATAVKRKDQVDVVLQVKDTGIGIEPEVLDRLFQPFCQGDASTARVYGGTGLGLTISKNLANLMKGQLELDSIPGVGSTATFSVRLVVPPYANCCGGAPIGWLPNRRMSHATLDAMTAQRNDTAQTNGVEVVKTSSTQRSRSADPPLSLQTLHLGTPQAVPVPGQDDKFEVLIVEDNAINQTIALKTVKKLGCTATAVWNGSEALSYIRSCISPTASSEPTPPSSNSSTAGVSLPSIILMDVQMPVMDGYTATRALRTQAPFTQVQAVQDIPIIALTASAIQGDQEKCLEAGMSDYLTKPVSRKMLESMLHKWGVRPMSGIQGGVEGGKGAHVQAV